MRAARPRIAAAAAQHTVWRTADTMERSTSPSAHLLADLHVNAVLAMVAQLCCQITLLLLPLKLGYLPFNAAKYPLRFGQQGLAAEQNHTA